MPEWDEEAFDEYSEDEAEAQEDDLKRRMDDMDDPFEPEKRTSRGGQTKIEEMLELTRSEKMRMAIKRALHTLAASIRPTTVYTILPVAPPWNEPARRAEVQKAGLDVEKTPPTVGTPATMTKPLPHEGVVFTVFDESGSVSQKQLAEAKTEMLNVCKSRNLQLIGVNMASRAAAAEFAAYSPHSPKSAKEFMKRSVTGGTEQFHKLVYDFDELMKHEEFAKRLDKALKDADIRIVDDDGRESLMTSKDILDMWHQRKVVGLVITDGYLPAENINTEKYLDYASNFKEPPLRYITTDAMNSPFAVDESTRQKLMKWYKV